MSDFGDFELGPPQEGGEAASEGLSEEAKQRFAAAAAAMQQLRRDEKRAKKKDDQVAKMIVQFLNDDRYAHLFKLIARLVARNCPSIFILGILSLIHEGCLSAVKEYFSEHTEKDAHETVDESMSLIEGKDLAAETHRDLVDWITRLQMILAHDAESILDSLLIDPSTRPADTGPHLDGAVLQLTIFVLQEFFHTVEKKDIPYEKAQPLTASILQVVFEPFLHLAAKQSLRSAEEDEG
ncbi:MAG TPA: hypothetical protein VJB82_02265 [Candidatus Peribacterales bacterium]|nr:hypothetical protein [Candidatus Peribacterales bacterium]